MELQSVKRAYRRHAPYYDAVFGTTLSIGRKVGMKKINVLSGRKVLEVGVGTGLSLAAYRPDMRIVGIDASEEMLHRARVRVTRQRLNNVDGLLLMDAGHLGFRDNAFDTIVAMYLVSALQDPAGFLREIQRVCMPGGDIVIVNHFAKPGGLRGGVEQFLSRLSNYLGWHPEFDLMPLLKDTSFEVVEEQQLPPAGLFTFVHLRNAK